MELNTIVEHFAPTLFQVQGVYRYKKPAGSKGIQRTASYPGFIFPLSGCAEYQFNDTPYFIKPGVVIHGSANTAMRKRVIGNKDWEFVSVLYETYNESPHMKLRNTHFSLTIEQSPQLYDMLHHLYATSKRPDGLAVLRSFKRKPYSAGYWKRRSCVPGTKQDTVHRNFSNRYRSTSIPTTWMVYP